MADLDFIRKDPAQAAYEERIKFIEAGEDRERRMAVEDEATRRERALNKAYHEGLQGIYRMQQGGTAPPVSGASPSTAAPSAAVAGPAPSPGSVPVSRALPQAPAPGPAVGANARANLGTVRAAAPGVDPIMERLLQDPSLAQHAMARHGELQEQQRLQREREDKIELQAMDALAAGDLPSFQYWAQQTNLQVPPEIVNNAQQRYVLGLASNLAQNFFGEDEQQAGLFIQGMLTNNGDVLAALQVSGMPRNRPDVKLEDIMVDGQRVKAKIDMISGVATPIQVEGTTEVAVAPPTGRSGGAVPAQIQLMEYFQAKMRNPDGSPINPAQALELANLAKSNPQKAAATVYAKVYSELLTGTHEQKAAQAQAAANDLVQYLQTLDPTQQLYQGPSTPAPASPTAAPTMTGGGPPPIPQPGMSPLATPAAPPPPGQFYDQATGTLQHRR